MNNLRNLYFALKTKIVIFLAYMDQGTMEVKLTISFILASISTFFIGIFRWISDETLIYLAAEKKFIALIVLFIICDSITGTWKNWRTHTLDVKKFTYGTLTKLFVSIIFAILFHGMVFILNDGPEPTTIGNWVLVTGRLVISIYIVSSALANIYIITEHKFPPKIIMSRFDKYNETLDISVLMGDKDKEELLKESVETKGTE